MKKRNIFNKLMKRKRKFIEKLKAKDIKNHNGKSFTRVRTLMLGRLLTIILRCSPYGLQTRLDDYFKEIDHKEETVSKQAFSKARKNLDPSVVKASFELTTETLSECEDIELYRKKFRLCAIDGYDIELDNAKELLEHFGGSGKNKDCATAMASLCYDPLNNMILDGGLYPYGTSERITFDYNDKEYCVRVFKTTLPNGEEELLVTNVSGKYLKRKEVGELYFKRWGIETKFNSLKNKLELENMSGRRIITTYQDFWAKLDLANTLTALEYATDEEIEEKTKDSDNKYPQTTNEVRLISKFTKNYIELLTEDDADKRLALFDELVSDICKYPVEVKLGRHSPRKPARKKKFSDRYKRALR